MNKKEIENLIYDYHWMRREVDRLENIIYGASRPMRSWGVAQYGIDAVMPKGSSNRSAAEMERMDLREERLLKRLEYYQEKVYAIELIVDQIKNEQQLIIIDCMMEGMSYRAIAAHLGIGRNRVRELKEDMLCQICQKCHFVHDLISEKSIV